MKTLVNVTTTTGESFTGASHREVVRAMVDSERLQARKRLVTFMMTTANRCALWNGSEIDPSNAQTFLVTLAEHGFIILETTTTTSQIHE